MWRSAGRDRRRWQRRFLGLGVVLIGLALGPLVYCLGFGEVAAEAEGLRLGVCLEDHFLRHPTALFAGGVASLLAWLILAVRGQLDDQEEAALERRIERVAARKDEQRGAGVRSVRGQQELVDGIELEEALDFERLEPVDEVLAEEDAASVMAFLEAERARRPRQSQLPPELEGVYTPPGMEHAAVLYVDGEFQRRPAVDPAERVGNPDLPHTTLEEALRQALRIVMDERRPVVVRVMPGVYQAGVELPDQVVLVNHRLPAEATVDQRLAWLEEQRHIDHPERVTILVPEGSDGALRLFRGQKQGIFGCYFLGRQGLAQRALDVEGCAAVAIAHCGFEGFSKGAVVVADSGEDLPGQRVLFLGCRWQGNGSVDRGGALLVERSAVRVEACVFENNIAGRGGAVAVVGATKPFLLERCLMQRNRAIASDATEPVEELSLHEWSEVYGVGGALLVEEGLAKVVDTIFEANDGAIAGGAIAAVGARVVFKSRAKGRGICLENRADAGGALFAVGRAQRLAMIRLHAVCVKRNLAKTMGGGGAAVGLATLHFEGGEVIGNHAVGGARRGFGGGLVAWRGATVQARRLKVSQNKAAAGGGGIAVLNAHLKIVDETTLEQNRAEAIIGGGALLVLTRPDMQLERLVTQSTVSLPFRVKLDGVRATENIAMGAGGGLRAGNMMKLPSFPMALVIRRPDWLMDNQSELEGKGQNLWVEWAEEIRVQDGARGRLELKLYAQSLVD